VSRSSQELESLALGPVPILNHFLGRLRLEEIFRRGLSGRERRRKLDSARALGVFVRNMLVSRQPLYALPEWAAGFVPEALGLRRGEGAHLNDDRVGRCLDQLFDSDRAALLTSFVLRMVEEFDLRLDVLHNDSTTVPFTGTYRRKGRAGSLRILHGHSKDHRPDLKQLLFEMTVTEDGAVPVLVGLHDGNVTDDRTHLGTWKTLRPIVGRPDFIYVADSKLCVTDTMSYIDGQKGRFVTVLPATRREEKWFKTWIQTHVVPWEEVFRRPPLRRRKDPPDVFRGFESPLPSAEGYRILWYHSSIKHTIDQQARQTRIERAVAELEFLVHRLGVRFLKTVPQVRKAAWKILEEMKAERWIDIAVDEGERVDFRQAGPGRPGKNTEYRKISRPKPKLTWRLKQDVIDQDAKTDGLFPLITNIRAATLQQVLAWYKYQPRLEKRFEQLKTVVGVRPVFLKNVERVEGYLLLHYMAMAVEALIERELRASMRKAHIPELPLYWEKRLCKAPTAERVHELFAPIRRHRLLEGDRELNRFHDRLSPLQRKILGLLGVSVADYAK